MYVRSVDTVRRKLLDRSTHMPNVSTHSEKTLKKGRHIYISRRLKFMLKTDRHTSCVCRHSQLKYLKEVDSLERRVDIDFNSQTYQVDEER